MAAHQSSSEENRKLRVAFLVGRDDASTRSSIESVCRLPDIVPAAVLLDTDSPSFRRRVRNLWRNVRTNGWSYALVRTGEALRNATSSAVANAAVSGSEVRDLLKKAFPERCFSLSDVARKYGFQLHHAGNLNGPEAVRLLRECGADLGIVLGARILKPGTFGVPRMGCINLHKGKVPEYRGMPPGFWELYDGAAEAGVTVHFIDKGLDTGDVILTSSVPILPTDTPETLRQKLNEEGSRVLADAVASLRDGTAKAQPQPAVSGKPRSHPRLAEIADLSRRLPHWKRPKVLAGIARNVYLLAAYYGGLYSLAKLWHRMQRSRAAIFLYHRVNDYSKDILTADTWTFAAQWLAISRRYSLANTASLVESIYGRKPIRPTTVLLHFDDCYRDILTNGAPILRLLGIPACAFVSSGFVDSDRSFPHDTAKYPFRYPMLTSADLREWTALGFELGAHTINHADLGQCTDEACRIEVIESGRCLQDKIGKPIDLFSFPFGRIDNISDEARKAIQDAGYKALFAAHGGFADLSTDPFDIPRLAASGESPAVYCLLEIEGLAPYQIASALRRSPKRATPMAKKPPRDRAPVRAATPTALL